MTFEEERRAEQVAEIFHALSHKRRVVILSCLLDRERSVGELVVCDRLKPTGQATVSQHLAVLRRAGLITERREGQRVIYRVSSPLVRDLLKSGTRVMEDRIRPLLLSR